MIEIKPVHVWNRLKKNAFVWGFLVAAIYHVTIVPWAWSQPSEKTAIFPLSMVSVLPGFVAALPVAIGARVYCESTSGYRSCKADDGRGGEECYALAQAETICTEPGLEFARAFSIVANFVLMGLILSLVARPLLKRKKAS